jgi:hypothetical protein
MFEGPGALELSEGESVRAYFTTALTKIPTSSEAELHELYSFMSTKLADTDKEFRKSGHVEDLPMEVAVDKTLPRKTLTAVVWVIYALEEFGGGKAGHLFKNFQKYGTDLAKGDGSSNIPNAPPDGRRSGLSQADQAFLSGQTADLIGAMPDKEKVDDMISELYRSLKRENESGTNQVASLREQMEDFMAGRSYTDLVDPLDQAHYRELSQQLREASQAANKASRTTGAGPSSAAAQG